MKVHCLPLLPNAKGFKVRQFLDAANVAYVTEHADRRIWCQNKAAKDNRRCDTDVNGRMTDSSKTRLEHAVQAAFGYGYAVNPRTWQGTIVEKSEGHGHRVWLMPLEPPKRGMFYSEFLQGKEWRIATFKTEWICTRTERKWENGVSCEQRVHGSSRYDVPLKDVMSRTERLKFDTLRVLLGLDYGEFDVIRNHDGRLCPIDVNPSPSPPQPHSFTPEDFAKIMPRESQLFKEVFL